MASFFARPTRICNRHRAFTLVELLVVIIIIGALSGMMMLGADALFGKSKATRCLNDRKIIEREYMLKKLDEPLLSADLILQTLSTNHNALYDAKKISGICPNDGILSCDLTDSERMIKISCSKHDDAGAAEAASTISIYGLDGFKDKNAWEDNISGDAPAVLTVAKGSKYYIDGEYYIAYGDFSFKSYKKEDLAIAVVAAHSDYKIVKLDKTETPYTDRMPCNIGNIITFEGKKYVCIKSTPKLPSNGDPLGRTGSRYWHELT